MMLNSKELVGTPVITKSGIRLGKLVSLNLGAETGRVAHIVVRPRFLSSVLPQELLISWTQIVSMDAEQIVVADAYLLASSRKVQKWFAMSQA